MSKRPNRENKKIEYPNGDIYEGDVNGQGQPGGKGLYSYANGDKYDGPWVDGTKQGKNGTYTYYRKDPRRHMSLEYKGDWFGGKKHGQGVMTFTNGDRYKGRWVNGKMETTEDETATYTYKRGHEYRGTWKANQKDGEGTFQYKNGDTYEGMFNGDVRHGKGRYFFRRGNVEIIKGTYDNDVLKDYKILEKRSSTAGSTGNRRSGQNAASSDSDEFGPRTSFLCKDDQGDPIWKNRNK